MRDERYALHESALVACLTVLPVCRKEPSAAFGFADEPRVWPGLSLGFAYEPRVWPGLSLGFVYEPSEPPQA